MIDKMDLSNKATLLRRELGEDESSPIDIFKLVQTIDNLTLVFYPLGENISGICYIGNKSNIIAINSDMSVGRQRFSLAHELYHLYYDKKSMNSISLMKIGEGDINEKKADQFASFFLIPQSSLYRLVEKIKTKYNRTELTVEDTIKIEQYYGVSHQAMLFRLLNDGYINHNQINEMSGGVIEIASRLGYDTTIYYPSVTNQNMIVLGHYIKIAEQLLENEKISQGKYEELLLTAFREDIVYGIDKEEVPLD